MAAQRKKLAIASPPSVGDLHAQLIKRGMAAPLLSVVVPVKNEEAGILPFVSRVGAILDGIADAQGWEILFVDDGSTDATLAAIVAANLADPRVRALSLSRNFGKEAALSAGLDHARGAADAERAHGASSRSARNQRSRSSHGTAAFAGDVEGSTKSSVPPSRRSCSPCGGRPPNGPR